MPWPLLVTTITPMSSRQHAEMFRFLRDAPRVPSVCCKLTDAKTTCSARCKASEYGAAANHALPLLVSAWTRATICRNTCGGISMCRDLPAARISHRACSLCCFFLCYCVRPVCRAHSKADPRQQKQSRVQWAVPWWQALHVGFSRGQRGGANTARS